MSVEQQFRHIVSKSLDLLSVEDLKPIVLAFWYEDYNPEIKGMNSIELRRAGYLIELLMSFNCISDTRQLELMKLTKKIKQHLHNSPPVLSNQRNNLDSLAEEWHLDESIFTAIQPLLKYQTRHYVHS